MIARYGSQELNAGGREGLNGLSVSIERQAQVVPLLRSERVAIFDRGNRVYRIAFSFAREYANLLDAHDEATKFLEDLAATGDLELEETGASASSQSTIYEGAVFVGGVPTQIGKTIIFALTFLAHSRKVIPS